MNCKYCQSENVIKYGKYKEVERYFCKDCKRKFAGIDTIPKMQYPTNQGSVQSWLISLLNDRIGVWLGSSQALLGGYSGVSVLPLTSRSYSILSLLGEVGEW